jgi:hypothetical protein
MPPLDPAAAEFGMPLVQLHTFDLQVRRDLLVVRLSPLGRRVLEAKHGLDGDPTDVGGPGLTAPHR